MATFKYGRDVINGVSDISVYLTMEVLTVKYVRSGMVGCVNYKAPSNKLKIEYKGDNLEELICGCDVDVAGEVLQLSSSNVVLIDGQFGGMSLSHRRKPIGFAITELPNLHKFLNMSKTSKERARIIHIEGDLNSLNCKDLVSPEEIYVRCKTLSHLYSDSRIYVKGKVDDIVNAHSVYIKRMKVRL